jgi:hypothetical protein
VPVSLRVRLLFGGLGAFAWLWLGIGSGIATLFLRDADLTSWWLFRAGVERAEGVTLGCAPTGASVNERRIYSNRYRFEGPGAALEPGAAPPRAEHRGTSYAPGRCLPAGAPVAIEHVPGRPEISRIAGMDRSTFGPGILFVTFFPLVGFALVIVSLVIGQRRVRLLSRGRLARGKLVGREETNVSVNDSPVVKLRFALEPESGGARELVLRSHAGAVLEDDAREWIFYDPRRPDRALAWDELPGAPEVDGRGGFEPAGIGATLRLLLPPAFAIAVHALVLGWR